MGRIYQNKNTGKTTTGKSSWKKQKKCIRKPYNSDDNLHLIEEELEFIEKNGG